MLSVVINHKKHKRRSKICLVVELMRSLWLSGGKLSADNITTTRTPQVLKVKDAFIKGQSFSIRTFIIFRYENPLSPKKGIVNE